MINVQVFLNLKKNPFYGGTILPSINTVLYYLRHYCIYFIETDVSETHQRDKSANRLESKHIKKCDLKENQNISYL